MASITNNAVVNYFKTSYLELTKVSWPTRQSVINHSLLVIGISLGVAAFFGVVDYGLSWLLEQVINR